jgi:hypothetical protein
MEKYAKSADAERHSRYEPIIDFNIEIVPADGHQCCRLRSGDLGKSPFFVQLFRPLQACMSAYGRYGGE